MTDFMSARPRRRSFHDCCGSLGLGSGLFPGALWAQSADGTAAITSDMIEAAARLAGLHIAAPDRDEVGKPTGILFVGKLYGETEMMTAARTYQDANDFHRAHPDLE